MNLYLISQDHVQGYDTYDSAVVAAESEEVARRMCPGSVDYDDGVTWPAIRDRDEHVKTRFIGVAFDDIQMGVLCASFNAG